MGPSLVNMEEEEEKQMKDELRARMDLFDEKCEIISRLESTVAKKEEEKVVLTQDYQKVCNKKDEDITQLVVLLKDEIEKRESEHKEEKEKHQERFQLRTACCCIIFFIAFLFAQSYAGSARSSNEKDENITRLLVLLQDEKAKHDSNFKDGKEKH